MVVVVVVVVLISVCVHDFPRQEYKLYRVCDESGDLEVTEVETDGGELDVKMLDPKDCFLLDCGTSLFVWVGKKSTEREKAGAMQNAKDFLKDSKRPAWTPST